MVFKGLTSRLCVALFMVSVPTGVVVGQSGSHEAEESEIKVSERTTENPRILVSIHEEDQPEVAFDNRDFMRPSIITTDVPLKDLEADWRCEGNACDAFLPSLDFRRRYVDSAGQKRLNSALGGLSGALIGEEIAGAPGAIVLGAIGAAAGNQETNKERWEKAAKYYDAAYLRGDDIFYNPVNRFPDTPHWAMQGPGNPTKK